MFEKDSIQVTLECIDIIVKQVEDIEYEKYIATQILPYSVETVLYSTCEISQLGDINTDTDQQ
jgi:hypothetical protein